MDTKIDETVIPVFNNKHNTMYHTEHGVKWHSRACAVVSHVWIIRDGKAYVLVGKRGTGGMDAGKYNVPCGYMDWSEDLRGASHREVWEEAGLNVAAINARKLIDFVDQPWFVYTDPSENRQNIVLHTGVVFEFEPNMILPKLSLDNMEENEVESVKWMTLDEVDGIPSSEWAYNHDVRLKQFKSFIMSKL